MNEIAIILPALNEEKAIGFVINEIHIQPMNCDIFVADSSSTDRTAEIASSLGAFVIPGPRGKGNAVRAIIPLIHHKYVFMLDADGTYPAYFLCDMLHKLENGYQVVVGERKPVNKQSMKLYNKACNGALNFCNNFFYGGKIRDICSGMWGFQGDVLKEMALTAPDFTLEADICTKVCIGKYKLASVPIEYRERVGGHSKIKFKDGFKIASVLVKRSLQ